MNATELNKKRILTGDNTTGRLHVGHYVGSLENRVKLQDEYETFIILADMPAFAYPKYVSNPEAIEDSVIQVALDNLAVGLDPKKVVFFAESGVSEISELAYLLSMLVSHNTVLRNPTLKDEIRDKNLGDTFSMGFLNFPILMAADILSVNADLVPVGEDQAPHLELTRELVRKFNATYGETLKEPQGLIGKFARLIGTDGGAKMTKSLDNCIFLSDSKEEVKRKVMSMYTDPSRVHATDAGKVEGNPVFIYHDAFNKNKEEVEDLKKRYVEGKVGDVEVKEKLFNAVELVLEPIREKRKEFEADIPAVKKLIAEGTSTVKKEALLTLDRVKSAMKLHF